MKNLFNILFCFLLLFITIFSQNLYSAQQKKKLHSKSSNKNIQNNSIVEINNVSLIKVIDGDTIEALVNNKPTKIRLLGIQAPELYTNPPWPFANESKQALENILADAPNFKIQYVASNKKDKYGRILADIFTYDEIWVNGYLIDKSLAYVYILNNSYIPYIDKLLQIENKAIKKNNLFWKNEKYEVIKANRAYQFVDNYKIIDGKIINILDSKYSIWLQFEETKQKGFSGRIDKEYANIFGGIKEIKKLKNKNVRIRGFVEKYSKDFGPFVDIQSAFALTLIK